MIKCRCIRNRIETVKVNRFKSLFLCLLAILLITAALVGCEKNASAPPSDSSGENTDSEVNGGEENGNGNTDTEKPEDGTGDGTGDRTETEDGDGINNGTSSEEKTTYPPSDPSDPYENDKHWDLP